MTATCDNLWDFGVAYSRTHPDRCAHRPKPLDLRRFRAQNPKKHIIRMIQFFNGLVLLGKSTETLRLTPNV